MVVGGGGSSSSSRSSTSRSGSSSGSGSGVSPLANAVVLLVNVLHVLFFPSFRFFLRLVVKPERFVVQGDRQETTVPPAGPRHGLSSGVVNPFAVDFRSRICLSLIISIFVQGKSQMWMKAEARGPPSEHVPRLSKTAWCLYMFKRTF